MITVLGSSGFIGRRLCQRLQQSGVEYYAPRRDQSLNDRNLGDVVYCIGLTADFRWRLVETVDAHVCKLLTVLRDCRFDSLLYLSSTRLYGSREGMAREEDPLSIKPVDADHVYNISKAMGESLVLNGSQRGRVARISNVYGDDFESENFLSSIIRDVIRHGHLRLRSAPDSEKDYIGIDDVVDALIKIATTGRHRIYNVAAGENVSNQAVLDRLSSITNSAVEFTGEFLPVKFPRINVDRITGEFGFRPGRVLEELDALVDLYRNGECNPGNEEGTTGVRSDRLLTHSGGRPPDMR
jgi:nucleoside-diphosphate-sugar epimerase